jgi:hypothetical protein
MIDLIIATFIISSLVMVLLLKVELFFVLNLFFVALISALRLGPSTSVVNLFGISLYTKDIFFVSEILFLALFFLKQIILNPKFFYSKYFQIPFVLLFVVILKTIFAFPAYGSQAFLSAKAHLFFFGNILFFSTYPLSAKRILSIFKIIFSFSLIYSIIGIFRYFTILPSIYSNYLGSLSFTNDFNAQRLFDRSDLEVLLIGSFYALVFLLINFKDNLGRFLPIFSWLSFFILLSQTRSMIIVFLFITFYLLHMFKFFDYKKLLIRFIVFSPIIFLLLFLLPIQLIGGEAFSYENLLGENSTFVFRNIVNLAYINYMDFQSYFFGMTFGDTPIVFPEYFFNQLQGGKVGLHNSYVELAYSFGIPYTLFLLYLIINVLKKLFLFKIENLNNPLFSLSIVSIISYIILSSMWTLGQFSGIVFGLAIASSRFKNNELR